MMIDLGIRTPGVAALRSGGGGTPAPTPTPTPTPTPAPTPTFNAILMEGDSITSTAPSSHAGDFYSYQYDDSRPDKIIEVRAQNSRSIGETGNLNDDSNTLFGNVAEDAAYAPDLLTMMIGANDFTGITDTTYRSRLIALRSAYSSARSAMKVTWSPPIAYNPTGTPHGSKSYFDTQRASLLADCRNPAVWSQWADFYLPMGEIPEFGDAALAGPLFGDSVHPNTAGQLLLFASYRAALDTILDPARANSTTMTNAAWGASETNLATAITIRRRIVVTGLAHTGTALGASIGGGGNPRIRVGGRAWASSVGTGSGNGHRLYNGDILEYEVTTSASNNTAVSVNLTIGSETRTLTYTTVAAVTPARYSHGGTAERVGSASASHTIASISFPATGTGLIAINTGDAGNKPIGVTWNGIPATQVFGQSAYISLSLYRVPVTAGVAGEVVIAFDSTRRLSFISYGTLEHADPVPVSASANTADNGAHPAYATASATVPASGIALGFLAQYGDGGASAGGVTGVGNTQIVSAFGTLDNGVRVGLIGGRRTTSGSVGFSFGGYANWPVGVAVFKAAGT